MSLCRSLQATIATLLFHFTLPIRLPPLPRLVSIVIVSSSPVPMLIISSSPVPMLNSTLRRRDCV